MGSSAPRDAAVVVTSDTYYKEPLLDLSGSCVARELKNTQLFRQVKKYIIQDNKELIVKLLQELMKKKELNLIITVGGTGLCPRDVTPAATSSLYDKPCPGVSTALMIESLKSSPHAALSCLTAGICGFCLIINFPGKPKACEDCLSVINLILPHALEQIVFDKQAYDATHREQMARATKNEQNYQKTPHHEIANQQIAKLGDQSDMPCAPKRQRSGSSQAPCHYVDSLWSVNNRCPKKVESPHPLVSFEDAVGILQKTWSSLRDCLISEIECPGDDALIGSVLVGDVTSTAILPPFKVSMMDGYVLNMTKRTSNLIKSIGVICARVVSDIGEFRRLQGTQEVLSSFFCYQVNTGGQVPEKDYVIVPFECTSPRGGPDSINVTIFKVPIHANYVREPGSDLNHDYKLAKGTRIGPTEFALLSIMRPKPFKIINKPKIGLLATGDELVSALAKHHPLDKVVDTNTPLLRSYFKLKGYTVVEFGISKDKPDELVGKISDGLNYCNILLISGGASMGTKDHVKSSLVKLGMNILFGRVNMKPGKPVAFAVSENGKQFVFSLPGNPASAYVTSVTLVMPLIEMAMSGATQFGSILDGTPSSLGPLIQVEVSEITEVGEDQLYEFEQERREFLRAKIMKKDVLGDIFPVRISVQQQSSRLASLQGCDCLVIIEPVSEARSESSCKTHLVIGQRYHALRI